MTTPQYQFRDIESRWQHRWESEKTFRTPGPGDEAFDASKPKYYVLDMFPYPSGVGLHVGHPLGYIATDIVARYKRMQGYNVLHPMGFDAFGLPAEQFAVEHGVHPRITTQKNIDNMVRQLKAIGLGYDWDRSLATTDVKYYKWTQWIFLKLFNSYFDEVANRAKPISQLVNRLESGELDVSPTGRVVEVGASGGMDAVGGTPIGARKWHELDATARDAVLANYRLAYIDEVPVNWCPGLGTVLANEEVTNDGRSERGNYPVYKRPLRQWMLRITAYADRLGDDLDGVDWPEAIRKMQRDWIGRSEGALVDFEIADFDDSLRVYTTRPDTLFGATYMVLAPEHPLVEEITTDTQREAVKAYQTEAEARSDRDRMADAKSKTGVDTGAFAINPITGNKIPIWIADYVMMGYGTGAIMAVPAHDTRDFDFAKAFELPIVPVVRPSDEWLAGHDISLEAYTENPGALDVAYTDHGVAYNSETKDLSINGLDTAKAKAKTTKWLSEQGLGRHEVQYKLRDWLFSRQRYWGEPFPILHDEDGISVGVPEDQLPVELPEMENFSPESSDNPDAPPCPPLGRAPESWRKVEIDGEMYQRELNSMPQWAGSCWYYLRYLDNTNDKAFVGEQREQYWMSPTDENKAGGVDLYVGGAEHAVLHLLYARFWHKVLFDLGYVSTPEPFGKLFNQGYIQAYSYQDSRGIYVEATKVEEEDGKFYYEGEEVSRSLGKMGKSLKNAVSPDEVGEEYGYDTLRLYEMYMGPLDQSKPWNTRDIVGVHRFLLRVWRNFIDEEGKLKVVDAEPSDDLRRLLHKTIKRVTGDMERMSYNTAIAGLIELNNALVQEKELPREVGETFVKMLAPMAPHISEELWSLMGHKNSVSREAYPTYEEQYLVEDEINIVVQVKGKVRANIKVPADYDDEQIKEAAMTNERIAELIEGKEIKKVIVVPKKLVNIVAV